MAVGMWAHLLRTHGSPWSGKPSSQWPRETQRIWIASHDILRKLSPDFRQHTEEQQAAIARGDIQALGPGTTGHLSVHIANWPLDSFARLEVGHKLAAALCVTDVPEDMDVHHPWEVWSLIAPDGLIGKVRRVWCYKAHALFAVMQDGSIIHRASELQWAAMENLVRGTCLAISSGTVVSEQSSARTPALRRRVPGAPDFLQVRFKLAADVKIDLRDHVAAMLSGEPGAKLTVQFLVRGHWRNQRHGPDNSLRKTIWIEPFWKGPEESRVLLRAHQAEVAP
jgi:hypothetical protein